MFKKLREFCLKPHLPKTKWNHDNARALYDKFSANFRLKQDYAELFECEM